MAPYWVQSHTHTYIHTYIHINVQTVQLSNIRKLDGAMLSSSSKAKLALAASQIVVALFNDARFGEVQAVMCVCVCVCVCVFVYTNIYIYVCIYIYIYIVHICMYVHIYVCPCSFSDSDQFISCCQVRVSAGGNVCMYACTHACMYLKSVPLCSMIPSSGWCRR
jgi:hypothetical protein